METFWGFTSLVNPERIARLLKPKSFNEVISELLPAIKLDDYEAEPFRSNRLRGCTRASFLLSADHDAYDAFFNSPVGYRAQYCRSHESGEKANRQILDSLQDTLIDFAKQRMNETFGLEQIAASLAAKDAKIWIDESEPASLPPTDLQIHIDYRPWVDRARKADALQDEEFIGAIRGVLAPFGTRLKVKGGWIDSNGFEQRDPCKDNRSEMIALNGFA